LNALVESRAGGGGPEISDIRLSSAALAAALPDLSAPPTCELFLTPTGGAGQGQPAPSSTGAGDALAGAPAVGDGWLLGLHAPAGASWGRFAHALRPEESARLFPPLVAAEREARPGEEAADVAFCPHPSLGDLCAHPPFRPHTLALTHWPSDPRSGGSAGTAGSAAAAAGPCPPAVEATDALVVSTVGTLELCADSTAPEPLALRRRGGGPLAPSAMHRVRSTTAPPGLWRLLAGWRLCRQHRPWAMSPGPLGALDRWPRVRVDGFVIAPASWRIPAALAQPRAPTAANAGPTSNVTRDGGDPAGASDGGGAADLQQELAVWREREALPRFVQLGREDELLPLDLASPQALAELRGHERVFEIWPPLGDTPDETGRRVELVVALVDRPNAETRAQLEGEAARVVATGPVLPPHQRSGLDDGAGWTTFKLFGVAEAQDGLLLDVVGRAVESARERESGRAPEIDGWFFQRYLDPPGRRAHLRLRVHSTAAATADAFAARLELHLAETGARTRGAVVSVETTPYFPEAARYGGPEALPFVHALFEADSDFVLGCLAEEAGDDDGAANAEVDGLLDGDQHADIRVSRTLALVTGLEALALGLGFDLQSRRALAARRRQALLRAFFDPGDGEPANTARAGWPAAFRALKPLLRARLASVALALPTATAGPESRPGSTARRTSRSKMPPAPSPPSRSLEAYARAIAKLAKRGKLAPTAGELGQPNMARGMARAALERTLPALLHVNAVRLLGPDRVGELQAYTFWERTLESLARHPATEPETRRR
jgi:thiopeptide-type bacteriocin biosynthesis protein